MVQVAAKGQPPEGTQAKPAGCRHGGSWNAGFDPATKEPKSMQKSAKTTKKTTKVQKDAKGTKLQFAKNLGPGLSSLAGV